MRKVIPVPGPASLFTNLRALQDDPDVHGWWLHTAEGKTIPVYSAQAGRIDTQIDAKGREFNSGENSFIVRAWVVLYPPVTAEVDDDNPLNG